MPAARVDAAPVDSAPVDAAPADARNDLIGRNRLHIVRPGDTLVDIAVAYRVGFVELAAANPAVDRWLPRPGTEVVIPQEHILPAAPRRGIVINLAELRLYHFGRDGEVASMPIGIGSEGLETPDGETTITGKRKNPTWWPPPSIRAEKPELPKAVPPGPDNPLGDYALELGWPLYRIHGTNLPYGVGRRVSHGCIRMYPADIETVFNSVRIGTPVTVVDQPVKVGWQEGRLFLEAHPTQRQADEIEAGRSLADWPPTDPIEAIRAGVGDAAGYVRIDWTEVRRIAEAREGVPGLISIGSVRLPSE
jgi:L,D-transpeptidase ErfK/SrfK